MLNDQLDASELQKRSRRIFLVLAGRQKERECLIITSWVCECSMTQIQRWNILSHWAILELWKQLNYSTLQTALVLLLASFSRTANHWSQLSSFDDRSSCELSAGLKLKLCTLKCKPVLRLVLSHLSAVNSYSGKEDKWKREALTLIPRDPIKRVTITITRETQRMNRCHVNWTKRLLQNKPERDY